MRALAVLLALALLAGCTAPGGGGGGEPSTGATETPVASLTATPRPSSGVGASPAATPSYAGTKLGPSPTSEAPSASPSPPGKPGRDAAPPLSPPDGAKLAEAVAAANATAVVRAFLALYPDARMDMVELGGCELASELGGRRLECYDELDSRRALVLAYWVGEGWSGPRACAVKVSLESATLAVASSYPPLGYVSDPMHCVSDEDCAVHVHGCSCANFIGRHHVPEGVEAEVCSPEGLGLGCACVGGSCTDVGAGKGASSPAVVAATDRGSYGPGEPVTVVLSNGRSGSIFAHQGALAVEAVERREANGTWSASDAYCGYPHCVYDIGPPDEVPPGGSASIVWRQLLYSNGTRLVAVPGTYRIQARYQTRDGPDPEGWEWRTVGTNEFELRGAGAAGPSAAHSGVIRGRVTDARGEPLPGVLVHASAQPVREGLPGGGWSESYGVVGSATTDQDGRYAITEVQDHREGRRGLAPPPTADYALDPAAPPWVPVERKRVEVSHTEGADTVANVVLGPAGVVMGRVTDPKGGAVTDALARVLAIGGAPTFEAPYSHVLEEGPYSGYYFLSGLPAGRVRFELDATEAGLGRAEQEADVALGSVTRLDVVVR